MHQFLKIALTYILPLAIGVVLVYATFNNFNVNEVVSAVKTGNYFVVMPVLAVSIAVYILRVLRWHLLYKTIQVNANKKILFASLATGYAVNFALPRMGEIIRALILKRASGININQSMGTIVFERAIDTICLLIIAITVFIAESFLNNGILKQFININNVTVGFKLIVFVALLFFLIIGVRLILYTNNPVTLWIKECMITIFKLVKVKKPFLFFTYTLGIWFGFYLMTYLWFYSFATSAKLNLYQSFTIMFLGVVARSLPIQAGSAGAYHFVVTKALIFYGISMPVAAALSIIIHGFQSILTLVLGLFSYLWLLFKIK